VRIAFYDVSNLADEGFIVDTFDNKNAIWMDSSKALNEFLEKVEDKIEELGIEEGEGEE
jgi:anion-transporting  ArsA/GET3 family ATPase